MFGFFSMWSWIVNRCASSREDLPAAPPGSPLALPLIYSLIHLSCCHMASLALPPLSTTPSIIPALPPSPFSYLTVAHLGGLSIRVCPSFSPPFPPLFLSPLPPSSCFLPPRAVATGPPAYFAYAAVHSQGQRSSDLATVSDWCTLEQATRVQCHANETHGGEVWGG